MLHLRFLRLHLCLFLQLHYFLYTSKTVSYLCLLRLFYLCLDGDRDALFARMETHVKDKYEYLFTRLQGFSFFITEEQLKTLPLKFRYGSAERLLEIMCQLRSPVYPIFP